MVFHSLLNQIDIVGPMHRPLSKRCRERKVGVDPQLQGRLDDRAIRAADKGFYPGKAAMIVKVISANRLGAML